MGADNNRPNSQRALELVNPAAKAAFGSMPLQTCGHYMPTIIHKTDWYCTCKAVICSRDLLKRTERVCNAYTEQDSSESSPKRPPSTRAPRKATRPNLKKPVYDPTTRSSSLQRRNVRQRP